MTEKEYEDALKKIRDIANGLTAGDQELGNIVLLATMILSGRLNDIYKGLSVMNENMVNSHEILTNINAILNDIYNTRQM